MTEFIEKFIAFIDILGFGDLVDQAEKGTGLSLTQITELLKLFGSEQERDRYERYGPFCCPLSQRSRRDLDFRLTQVSDCAIISTEISPAGVINLVSHCWGVVIQFLQHGLMCRGYITRGKINHSTERFVGTGYQNAYDAERNVSVFKRTADEKGTPFVEVDPAVCSYITAFGDSCVKEMFSRMTESDGEGIALYPFKRLGHSFVIGGFGETFDPNKEKRANDNLRKALHTFRYRVTSHVDDSNPRAVSKAEHYLHALDEQLHQCDETDELIDRLCRPFPGSSHAGKV